MFGTRIVSLAILILVPMWMDFAVQISKHIIFSVQNDCLVKIWYPCSSGGIGVGTPPTYSFCYVAHPRSVRGFVWRRITPSFPKCVT